MSDSQTGDRDRQDGIGPFTLREVILGGVWLVAFLVSFFPFGGFGGPTIWTSGIAWILAIGVPTVAVGLLALRRLSPDAIRRVGSLGIDQFASVAFSVAAVVWLQIVWVGVADAIAFGGFPGPWVAWVEFLLMLGGVALTVFATLIPVVGDDFSGRREVPAHRYARPPRPVQSRPAGERAPRPAREPKPPREPKPAREPKPSRQDAAAASAAQQTPDGWETQPPVGQFGGDRDAHGAPSVQARPGYDQPGSDSAASRDADTLETEAYTPIDLPSAQQRPAEQQQPEQQQPAQQQRPAEQQSAPQQQRSEPEAASAPVVSHQAFWALAPDERDVVDSNGTPLFRIGPTAWALVIEDRGSAFVVRDEDGRTGFLTDVSGVMRG